MNEAGQLAQFKQQVQQPSFMAQAMGLVGGPQDQIGPMGEALKLSGATVPGPHHQQSTRTQRIKDKNTPQIPGFPQGAQIPPWLAPYLQQGGAQLPQNYLQALGLPF